MPRDPLGAATAVIAALDRAVAVLLAELGRPPAWALGDVEAVLPLPVVLKRDLAEGPSRRRAEALLGRLRERLDAATRGVTAFREGHVYCFHTNQPESPYSSPQNKVDVFSGYSANGRPEWVSFPNLCITRKEPRVDRLYGDPPEVLAMVIGPDALGEGLLPAFGKDSLAYRLLGQVVLGLVPEDLDLRSRAERVALTLQVVETSQLGLQHRLRLNVIGLPREAIAEAAASQDATSPAEAFRKVLRMTRGRIDGLGRQAALAHKRGEAFDLGPHVTALLTRLRADLLRVFKTRDYRTQHAQDRHDSRERPTAQAISDALAATEGRFLRDERKDTIIVLGPKNRVHVFSSACKHVTSLELQPTEVERRLELRRWHFLERVGSELFKARLRSALDPDAAPAGPAPHAPPRPPGTPPRPPGTPPRPPLRPPHG
jgi:hypothetical protein